MSINAKNCQLAAIVRRDAVNMPLSIDHTTQSALPGRLPTIKDLATPQRRAEHLKIDPTPTRRREEHFPPAKKSPISRLLRCMTSQVGRSHKMDVSYGRRFTGIPEHTEYRICHANSLTRRRSFDGY